jgi:hypothetical protein
MNNEMEMFWEEAVMTCLKIFLGETEENYETP